VKGSVSWVAAAVDLTVALVTAILPQARTTTTTYRGVLVTLQQRLTAELTGDTVTIAASRSLSVLQVIIKETRVRPTVAGQATLLLDTINCAAAAADGISSIRDWASAGNAIVGIARSCLAQIATKMKITELKEAVETIHEIANIAKVVPEIGQLIAMDILRLFGQNATNATFTIRRGIEPRLDPRLDPRIVRFDGIGDFNLRLTATDLVARGYVNEGNLYEGLDAPCVRYAKEGQPLSFSVESTTGRVLAINDFGSDPALRTQVGNIGVGSTLAQVRTAFTGYRIDEYLDANFGQGSNGIVINGPGGSIGLSLSDASQAEYAAGRATISFVNGVGLPGNAPNNMEDGC
jgi:hypothetical protein